MTMVHHSYADACRVGPVEMSEYQGHRVLLLGEDNPQSARWEHALWPVPAKGKTGCAGRNLQLKILAVSHLTYFGLWRTNLCNPAWSTPAARDRMVHLLNARMPWRTIVLLGRKVSSAAEHALGVPVPTWSWVPGEVVASPITVVSLPHPSGLTRDWNDATNYERARALLREVDPSVPWGELGRIPAGGPQVEDHDGNDR